MEKLKMRILLLLLCCESIFANEFGSITGVIEDLESKEALIGANVIISGTANGAATDFEGKFFIQGVEPGMISLLKLIIKVLFQVIQTGLRGGLIYQLQRC